jgi:hypothetical protein
MPKYRRGSGGVYKRGKTFWIAYYGPDGKQVCESAKTRDKVEVREKLKQRLGEIATARYVGPEAEKVTVAELLAT